MPHTFPRADILRDCRQPILANSAEVVGRTILPAQKGGCGLPHKCRCLESHMAPLPVTRLQSASPYAGSLAYVRVVHRLTAKWDAARRRTLVVYVSVKVIAAVDTTERRPGKRRHGTSPGRSSRQERRRKEVSRNTRKDNPTLPRRPPPLPCVRRNRRQSS